MNITSPRILSRSALFFHTWWWLIALLTYAITHEFLMVWLPLLLGNIVQYLQSQTQTPKSSPGNDIGCLLLFMVFFEVIMWLAIIFVVVGLIVQFIWPAVSVVAGVAASLYVLFWAATFLVGEEPFVSGQIITRTVISFSIPALTFLGLIEWFSEGVPFKFIWWDFFLSPVFLILATSFAAYHALMLWWFHRS